MFRTEGLLFFPIRKEVLQAKRTKLSMMVKNYLQISEFSFTVLVMLTMET